jgi:hypothetical protein
MLCKHSFNSKSDPQEHTIGLLNDRREQVMSGFLILLE